MSSGGIFLEYMLPFGANALVQAYNLECTVAIYPRIIIHPDLIADIDYFKKKTNNISNDLINWITQDQDGLCYVDYFNAKLMKDPLLILTIFIGDNAQRQANHLDNLKVVQKIIWHGNYLKRKMTELSSTDDVKKDACNV